jgi:hypothetical protein
MPEPMMAPMPSAVSDHGPSDFCSRWPGSAASAMSRSIDLRAKSWLASGALLRPAIQGDRIASKAAAFHAKSRAKDGHHC